MRAAAAASGGNGGPPSPLSNPSYYFDFPLGLELVVALALLVGWSANDCSSLSAAFVAFGGTFFGVFLGRFLVGAESSSSVSSSMLLYSSKG